MNRGPMNRIVATPIGPVRFNAVWSHSPRTKLAGVLGVTKSNSNLVRTRRTYQRRRLCVAGCCHDYDRHADAANRVAC